MARCGPASPSLITNAPLHAMQATRPLPWCQGPKLDPFRPSGSSNPKLELLEEVGSGLHSVVYRAKINNTIFAIKVFKFFKATQLVTAGYLESALVTVDEVLNQNDPFHAECRAYGRLKEAGKESLALKSHGYLYISPQQEEKLDPLGDRFLRAPWNRKLPLRAIVKEYISPQSAPFTRAMIPQMKRDLRSLNRLGIVVYDLRVGNYLNGKIIDFSQAHTSPHFMLVLDNPQLRVSTVRRLCSMDFANFDEMIDDWNEAHPGQQYWNRFFPNGEFAQRLRNTSRFSAWFYETEEATSMLDAVHYRWKKTDKKRAPKAHVSSNSPLSKVTKKKKARRKPRR